MNQLLSFPQIGLNKTLSNLTSPATLFAPNNEAFTIYNTAANITHTEALSSPLLAGFAQLLVVPEALLVGSLQQHAIRSPQIYLTSCIGHAWGDVLQHQCSTMFDSYMVLHAYARNKQQVMACCLPKCMTRV